MLLSIALAMASLTTSFDVSGVHVILRQNNANNVVAANLYLLGGARQVTEGNAGIEPILLDVSERGTQRYPKNSLRRAMSRLGSEIVVAPSADWTMFGIRSSTEVFDSTWAIFADRVMHPNLAKAEVNLVKSQYLSGIRQRRDDPDALAGYLADSITFVGHPYAVSVTGTERSLQAVDSATLRDYHRTQFVTSRMLLVVVGNVDRAHIERLVSQSIGRLPRGEYKWTAPPRVPESQTAVVIERRQLPTNYIIGYYSGPLANGRDYQALRVATSVLTGRMFAEIRTRQNLTYDVHAPFVDRAATAGGLYVSTVAPDTTLKLMRAAIVDLQQGMLDPAGLRQLEDQFITEYFLDNETNAAQADFLARSELYGGDYKEADRFVDELKRVSPEDIQRVARRYMKGFRFAYVGDPSKLNPRTISLF
ncbi:MAG TPA: pitrilysin family protein [Gemmatimonadaceae bacterium]|jgi:zinc protease|nr:pitrilysin family protein [Gemmatimonadaceae bacterium]HMH86977.1 pitrilysin family protein [Gemmatimonadaceae bacterium]HMI42058.1 pitrilysin family protein [Gemmatimonadaceae bacterium]